MLLNNSKQKQYFLVVPLAGTAVFVSLYIMATLLYPGGSQADKNAKGFSWINNYWCNMLNEYAMNGEKNTARPVAFAGMSVLCISLAVFWILFPIYAGLKKNARLVTQLCGCMAMTIGFFLFSNLHDIIINVAMLGGLVAIGGTFAGLHKLKWKRLIGFGVFNLLLVVVNNV